MLILTLRTDKPEAEVGLFDANKKLAYETWRADRELSVTLHSKLETILKAHHKTFEAIDGIVAFQGPGSFTGLRIGLAVANTMAYGLGIPIIGALGDDWVATGIVRLKNGENDQLVLPEYGAPVHITQQKK